MPEEPMAEREIDRLWNDLVTGRADADGYALEEGMTEAVRAFQAQAVTPTPQTSRDRVERDVLEAIALIAKAPGAETLVDQTIAAPITPPLFAANGSGGPIPLAVRPAWRRGWSRGALAQLATAALLLLTLTAGFLAFRQGQPPEDEPIVAPALVATPDSAPGTPAANEVADTTLFTATFTADELPAGEVGAVFYRLTLAPGATLPNLSGLSCGCSQFTLAPGVGAELVESGEYTVRLDAPLRVQRDGAPTETEEVPARTEITLGSGDAAIYPEYDAPGAIRNTGREPVLIVGVAMVETDESATPPRLPEGVTGTLLTQTVSSDWEDFPAGPVTVTLRQVTLPAEAALGPYQADGLEALQLEQGAITRGVLQPGETAPRVRLVPHFAGASDSLPFVDVAPGVRRIITNVRDEPAVLLILTIEPAGGGPTLLGP